jgi:RNA polymerase sigma-70 factor (ECF subfamily)
MGRHVGHAGEIDLGEAFHPFAILQEQFGFVPSMFRAQTMMPTAIEAEVALLDAVLFKQRALTRTQKECILLVSAAANGSAACAAIHYQMLRLLSVPEARLDEILADYRALSPVNAALVALALKIGVTGTSISRQDVYLLSACDLTDDAVLEAVLTTAVGNFLCTLSIGLGAVPDFPAKSFSPIEIPAPESIQEESGPFLRAPERAADDFAPFGFFREQFGFVPSVFQAQTLRPDVLEAEAELIRGVLVSNSALTGLQKECILGDQRPAELTDSDQALLDFARNPAQVDLLRQRFAEEQILEAVATAALAHFLDTLHNGLGSTRDFPLRRFQRKNKAHLSTPDPRHSIVEVSADPDAEWVARVRSGHLGAFEELMKRHRQRVYRTLVGLLGDPEEARDAMQDTFLKVFQSLGHFEGRSKFSTWLLTIASNTAIQRLRDRKHVESLDESDSESEEGFRPRQVQAWTEDPEQLYSKTEMRNLVEGAIMKLPIKYRAVLMMRDIQQLSTEESAAVLNLGVPAVKARLLRGRLMLREALSPHFTASARGVTS